MAQGPRYAVKFRRRREGRTDYKKRLAMLKSNTPRFVIRKSNKMITCQIIEYKTHGDITKVTIVSKDLFKLGWKHSLRNIAAAYLTGLLAGKLAIDLKIKKAIADFGLQPITNGSTLFAALKGAVDAGLEIPHSPERFPSEDRIFGKHLKKDASKDFAAVKDKILKAKAISKKKETNK